MPYALHHRATPPGRSSKQPYTVLNGPGRIAYHCVSPPKRRAAAAVCRKWHNLGSWSRATTGDYRFSSVIEVPPSASLTTLPDYEHPRLVLVLPPVQRLSHADWSALVRFIV